jgi:hypothetical protein
MAGPSLRWTSQAKNTRRPCWIWINKKKARRRPVRSKRVISVTDILQAGVLARPKQRAVLDHARRPPALAPYGGTVLC